MASSLVNWLRRSISEHDDVNEHEHDDGPRRRSSEVTGRRPSGLEVMAGGILSKWYTTSHDENEELMHQEQELEELSKKKQSTSLLQQLEMPEIIGESNILTEQDIERLTPELPPRKVGSPWRLAYNSETHGFSLQSLYRHVAIASTGKSNEPCLLIIRDTHGHRFGAVVPDTFRIQDREKFYGSGETFVFRLEKSDGDQRQEHKVWKFSHSNFYVIFCSHDNLSVGSGDGHPAIWLDSNLDKGRTDVCPTYQSEPLVPGGDFQVSSVEVWIFDE